MKKQAQFTLFIVIILLMTGSLALNACAPARQAASTEKNLAGSAPRPMEAPALGAKDTSAPYMEYSSSSGLESPAQDQERIVIKNASLTIVVADPSEAMNNITRMSEGMGGFVVTANMYQQTISGNIEVPRATITVRVPARKLNEALDTIRMESKQKPLSESINSQDVTNEYVDLTSRLKNLEAAETELTRIMEDARKTEDVLAVYNQLVEIRGQIEVIKGQMKYYEQSAAMSAISTELIADAAVQPIEIAGWKPVGQAKQAVESLIKTMQGLMNAIIWIVIYLLPVLLVLFIIFVLPIILIIRAFRRRQARRKTEIEQKDPTA